MANITINQLSTQNINDSDAIVKTDNNGVLSKASLSSVKSYVIGGDAPKSYADFYNEHQGTPLGVVQVGLSNTSPKIVTGRTPEEAFSVTFNVNVTGFYQVMMIAGLGVEAGNGASIMQFLIDDTLVGSPSLNGPLGQAIDVNFISLSAGQHTLKGKLFGLYDTTKALYNPNTRSKLVLSLV